MDGSMLHVPWLPSCDASTSSSASCLTRTQACHLSNLLSWLHYLLSDECMAATTGTLLIKIRNHKLYDRYFYYDPEVRA